jgi:hypothetical protein
LHNPAAVVAFQRIIAKTHLYAIAPFHRRYEFHQRLQHKKRDLQLKVIQRLMYDFCELTFDATGIKARIAARLFLPPNINSEGLTIVIPGKYVGEKGQPQAI